MHHASRVDSIQVLALVEKHVGAVPVIIVDNAVRLAVIQVHLVIIDYANLRVIILDPLRIVFALRLGERPVVTKCHAGTVMYDEAAQIVAVVR